MRPQRRAGNAERRPPYRGGVDRAPAGHAVWQAVLGRRCCVPERIQLKRSLGWRMPPNTVKVDRTTRWGNPMTVRPGYPALQAVEDYQLWLEGKSPWRFTQTDLVPPSREDIQRHLAGKNLACWCPAGSPCHAEILLSIANAAPGTPEA